MAFVMIAVLFASMPVGVASPGGLIFHAHFDSDTPGAPPDTTLPGPPAGDSIAISDPAGFVMVQSSVGDLTNQPVEVVHTGGIGSIKMYGTVAGTPPTSGIWYASWYGLVQQGNYSNVFGPMVFRDSSSLILAAVAYRENGIIDFNDLFPSTGIGVPYTQDVSQFFELTIDLDAQLTSLSIDGFPIPMCQNMAYYQPSAVDLAHMNFEVGYTTHQAYALDDLKIWSDVVDATVDINPNTLNLKSKGKWITGRIELPVSDNTTLVDIPTVAIVDINGVPVNIPAEWGNCDIEEGANPGEYILKCMVKFDRSAVQDACVPGPATITIAGQLTDGTAFEGSDTINVINPP
jgi:hypothetical protein